MSRCSQTRDLLSPECGRRVLWLDSPRLYASTQLCVYHADRCAILNSFWFLPILDRLSNASPLPRLISVDFLRHCQWVTGICLFFDSFCGTLMFSLPLVLFELLKCTFKLLAKISVHSEAFSCFRGHQSEKLECEFYSRVFNFR